MHQHSHTIAMLQRVRAAQRALLPARLSALPSWDILLTVAGFAASGRRECISTVARAAAVPFSSAQRCIETLEAAGLVLRSADPLNQRRLFVTLTPLGRSNLDAMLTENPPTLH